MNNNVRELRIQRNLTQQDFSKEIEVSQQQISRIENGELPSFSTAMKIAKYFNKKVEDIFFADKYN